MSNDSTAVIVGQHAVMIGAETYTLTEIPKPDSSLVKQACDEVMGNLNLDKLISDLELCKQLIFLARNGVQGAGTEESIAIVPRLTKLHEDFTKVCGRADMELTAIAQCSVQIQTNLLDVYEDLYDGEFNAAAKSVARFSSMAQKLADSAHALAAQFNDLEQRASGILGDTQVALGKNELAHKKLEQQIQDLQIQTDKAKRLVTKLREAHKKLEEDYQEAKSKADDAETKAFSMAIVGAIFKPLAAGIGAGVAMYTGGATGALKNRLPAGLPENMTKTDADKALSLKKQEKEDAEAAEKKAAKALADAEETVKSVEKKEKEITEEVKKLEAKVKTPDSPKEDAAAPAEPSKETATAPGEPKKESAADKAEPKKEDAAAAAKAADKKTVDEPASQLAVAKADLKATSDKVKKAKAEREERATDHKAAKELLEAKLAAVKQAVDAAGEAGDKFTKMGDDYQAIAKSYRDEVRAMRKLLAEQVDQEHEALSSIQEYAARMKNAGPDLKGIELACDSLFQAVGALKQIVMILQEAGYFWEKMATACSQVKNASFTAAIQRLEDLSEKRRIATLSKNSFQEGMLRYYAAWKALEVICRRFAARASQVRQEAAADFKNNLSTEEARLEARKLGERLLTSVTSGLKTNEATKLALKAADDEIAASKPKPDPTVPAAA